MLIGIVPIAVALVLIFLIYGVGKNRKGPHPTPYQLSEKWTHEPILWASEEPVDHGHSHGSHPLTIGGGASGKW